VDEAGGELLFVDAELAHGALDGGLESAESKMRKLEARPISVASRRSRRRQMEWKVPMNGK
jgi:hypothetical protein